jgi:crooked neck
VFCKKSKLGNDVEIMTMQIWIMAAHFEVRQMQLTAARKILGRGIGMCPKAKLFRSYIELELQLGAIDRVRTLYQKFLEWAPANCTAWCKFADLERSLGELDRARSIYELAVAQPQLDMPEVLWKVGAVRALSLSGLVDQRCNVPPRWTQKWPVLAQCGLVCGASTWKAAPTGAWLLHVHQQGIRGKRVMQAYIDFEIGEGERARTRALYERLLDKTTHVKIWMSYAAFEAAPLPMPDEEDMDEDEAAARRQVAQSSDEAPAKREARARRHAPYSLSHVSDSCQMRRPLMCGMDEHEASVSCAE